MTFEYPRLRFLGLTSNLGYGEMRESQVAALVELALKANRNASIRGMPLPIRNQIEGGNQKVIRSVKALLMATIPQPYVHTPGQPNH